MFPVLRVAAGSKIKTCASQSARAVLDATRHYAQFAGPENDSTVAELNDHFAAPHEEKFVFTFVVVPWKHSRKFRQFQFLAIQLGKDLRTPVLMDCRELFVKGCFRHRALLRT